MFLNTKTIKAIAVLSFAKKSIASCGCSIEALTGQTVACTIPSMAMFISVPDFATEGSAFPFSYPDPSLIYVYDSTLSAGQGKPAYTVGTYVSMNFEMSADSSIGDNECSFNQNTYLLRIGCWACPPPTTPPTVFPTSSPSDSPSDSPSFGNDDEDNDENNNESDDEDEDDEENDDGCCCCCEEKEVESSLLWTIKNLFVVGN